MRWYRVLLLLMAALILWAEGSAYATGEIALVRAPEELPQGDDITIVVSASAREEGIDRVLALDVPDSWKLKRAWKVEAGADKAIRLPKSSEISALFQKEPGRDVVVLADNSSDFDPDAEGIAYFAVFSTKPLPGTAASQSVSIKAALVERTDPDAPTEVDSKTKRPLPRMVDWRMTYPPRSELTFKDLNAKRLALSVRMDRVQKSSRSLVVQGTKHAEADLHTRPELLSNFFAGPFSLQFWFKATNCEQNLLRLTASDGREVIVGIGLLGQPRVFQRGAQARSLLASKSLLNDGGWHNLVISKDSLGKVRMFVDAQLPSIADVGPQVWRNIGAIAIGDTSPVTKDFTIDELRFTRTAFREPSEFDRTLGGTSRDTAHQDFAVFHFEDFGGVARSSIAAFDSAKSGDRLEPVPMFFSLDSEAQISETTSPVQLDPVMLTADLSSANRVTIAWKTTSEIGVKQYLLERRVGTFGSFDKVLFVEAKHGTKTPKRGQPIVTRQSYSVSEELPRLNGDIDLYYRVAILGFSEKDQPVVGLPVKVEYGADRDVFVEQNDPNPFNPTTVLAFRLTKPETVRLSVFDIMGREVAVIASTKMEAGRHTYTLDATNWPPGIYFYKVKTARFTVTRKMILVK